MTAPQTKFSMCIRYMDGSKFGVADIDGRQVGEISFVDRRSMDQFMAVWSWLSDAASATGRPSPVDVERC